MFFFFKQKTAYEMRISDWSSDVCSSDLAKHKGLLETHPTLGAKKLAGKKRTRRLSAAEIEMLGKAIAYAEAGGENPIALGVLRTLLLTGYRCQEEIGRASCRERVCQYV